MRGGGLVSEFETRNKLLAVRHSASAKINTYPFVAVKKMENTQFNFNIRL
jgi:hypothetical protein